MTLNLSYFQAPAKRDQRARVQINRPGRNDSKVGRSGDTNDLFSDAPADLQANEPEPYVGVGPDNIEPHAAQSGIPTTIVGQNSISAMVADSWASPPNPDTASGDHGRLQNSRFNEEIVVACDPLPLTFADALKILTDSGTLTSGQLATLCQAVGWVQRRLPRNGNGGVAAALPMDPSTLRPILATIRPGALRILPKTWSNTRSQLASVQRRVGWLPPRTPRYQLRSLEWIQIVERIPYAAHKGMFRKFAAYCEVQGIEPQSVTVDHFAAYGNYIEKTRPKLKPDSIVRAIRTAWNRICRSHPECGGQRLPRKRLDRWIKSADDSIPGTFFTDLQAYVQKLRHPGLFTQNFPNITAERSIASRQEILELSAAVLIRQGWDPQKITSLASILCPAAVECILAAYHQRNNNHGKWTAGGVTTAVTLRVVARQWGRLSSEDLNEVSRLCKCVRAPKMGFPERSRERLAQLDNKSKERQFLGLPKLLWDKARKLFNSGRNKKALSIAKFALALAILFDKPLRRVNLVGLDLNQDFERNSQGRIIGIKIKAPRAAKGSPIIEAALSATTQRMLATFIDVYRPHLLKVPTTALFPGKTEGHANEKGFGRSLTLLIEKEIGLIINPHLIRSYIATIILDEDPRALVVAQRLLDHRSSTTTARHYAMQRGRAVQAEYVAILERRDRTLSK